MTTEPLSGSQFLRALCALGVLLAYVARVALVGNGMISAMGFELNPFVVTAVVLLILALPETLDHLPFGPSRN